MFLINTEIKVNWLLPATTIQRNYNDFDVIVRDPDNNSTYYTAPILQADYIAPSEITTGGITYRITPDKLGVWVIILVFKGPANEDIFFEYFMEVSINDTTVYQQVRLG